MLLVTYERDAARCRDIADGSLHTKVVGVVDDTIWSVYVKVFDRCYLSATLVAKEQLAWLVGWLIDQSNLAICYDMNMYRGIDSACLHQICELSRNLILPFTDQCQRNLLLRTSHLCVRGIHTLAVWK